MRRYDLDSLRVLAFALLILYHVGMFFVPWGFHIKNPVTYDGLRFPMLFVNQWRLSLLFVVSGMGTFYALQKRSGGEFTLERLKRLFIPFIFGMFFIVPPQIYFERLDKGQFDGGYFDFWPVEAFGNGFYPEGNLSWHHLWFILYLFIFSLLLIPVFLYLKRHGEGWFLGWLRRVCSKPLGFYVFIVPLFLWRVLLAHSFPQTNGLVNDWFSLVNYCSLFFFGFVLIALRDVFWESVTRNRQFFLINGVFGFSFLLCLWFVTGDFLGRWFVADFVRSFNMWSWILALIGYSSAYLNRPGKWLAYSNEAVYPFYILHQTVIIALGYFLMDLDWGFFPKFLVMVVGTFGICWLIYEFCIRRFNVMRVLFGMKSGARTGEG